MSYFSDFAENSIADFVRGQGLSLPDSWFIALGYADSDDGFVEISGAGYARVEVPRSLTDWSGTQGAGTTLASTGTSHTTSNNAEADFGVAGVGGWGTVSHIGIFDGDASDGLCWFVIPLTTPLSIAEDDPVSFPAGHIELTFGLSSGCSDYLSNKLVDLILRDQAYTWPGSTYAALYTAAPVNAGVGTEVSGAGYARVAIASSMTAWSGTQAPASTNASSGTGGRISNNAAINFGTPTGSWGTVSHFALRDASTLGNLLFYGSLAALKSIQSGGSAPGFLPNQLGITFA